MTLLQLDQYYRIGNRCGALLAVGVQKPHSRGTISLASGDPLDRPLIDPRLMEDPKDRHFMKAGEFLKNNHLT